MGVALPTRRHKMEVYFVTYRWTMRPEMDSQVIRYPHLIASNDDKVAIEEFLRKRNIGAKGALFGYAVLQSIQYLSSVILSDAEMRVESVDNPFVVVK